MPYDVFISYSSIDKPVADAAVAVLERSRIRCWVAPRDIMPGSDWGGSVIQGIRSSRLMLVIFSSHANSSEQVKREVERAVHQGIPIIPLRIENIQPTGSMELFLSTPHWLDALSSPMEAHLEHLARTVYLMLYGAEQPPTPAQGAWTTPAPNPPVQQWTPPQTTPPPASYPAAAKPFPLWVIAVILGGLVALSGVIYLARSMSSSSSGILPGLEPAGPKIASVSFYESGIGSVPKAKRKYEPRFATNGTRYINWEANLQYPQPTSESKVVLEVKWIKPDGSTETKQDQIVDLAPGTTNITVNSGWGTKDGGYFHAGTYVLEFYVSDKKIGDSKFEVYDGDAPPSGYIQSLEATVGSIVFYESGTGRIPKEQRRYETHFPHSARYINWEMHLSFPKPASHTPFTIHEVWHRPDGTLEREGDFPAYIEPEWINSTHSSDGWGSAKGGTYQVGTYHVDFYVDKRKIASTSFDIDD